MLLFSATVPYWVREVADKYMSHDKVVVDLIGRQSLKTAVTVEHKAICCPYVERPSTIADVIQVRLGNLVIFVISILQMSPEIAIFKMYEYLKRFLITPTNATIEIQEVKNVAIKITMCKKCFLIQKRTHCMVSYRV